ncbi:MAG: hypothetical protein A2Z15_05580 [Chloroflexi bacterium RBG_16_50_11]|nr:MAG: hypothetical protein A2Z15_05580 [Chloroflexi bacterium RBG_16_50_11]
MRILALIVMVIGLAALVCGVIFLPMASSGRNEIATSIAPLTLDQVNAKYDVVAAKYDQIKMAEEPAIQAQTAMPSAMYNYLSAQRALLGLAKANIGTVNFIQFVGILNILIGLGMVLTGFFIFRKNSA